MSRTGIDLRKYGLLELLGIGHDTITALIGQTFFPAALPKWQHQGIEKLDDSTQEHLQLDTVGLGTALMVLTSSCGKPLRLQTCGLVIIE